MKTIWDIIVHTAQRSDGKWVAATDSSPYFYVEGESEDSALLAAQRALITYRDAAPVLHGFLDGERRTIAALTYSKEKAIGARDLVA